IKPDAVTDDFAREAVTGVHEQGVANGVESVRLFYFPVNLTIPINQPSGCYGREGQRCLEACTAPATAGKRSAQGVCTAGD
ncbi:hypothetical protein, partial [Phormidesmis priestleyi]